MPEYKHNASGAAWVVLRSWAGVRESLTELKNGGQDVAAFRVRKGPGDASETRADEHPETQMMEVFRRSESEKVQSERPESGRPGAVDGGAGSVPAWHADLADEIDDLEEPTAGPLHETPIFSPPAAASRKAASRKEATASPKARRQEAISGSTGVSVVAQVPADHAGHRSPSGTLPKAIHGVSWPEWLPPARLSKAAVALVGCMFLLFVIRPALWSDAKRIEPFVGPSLALQHVAGDTTGCLDVWWGRAEDGNKVQTWTCNGSDAQIWRLEKLTGGAHSGRYRLVSALANGERYCLDGRNRSRMEIWRCVSSEDVEATYQSFDLSSSRGGWTMTFRFEDWSAVMLAERDVSDPRGSVGQRRRDRSAAAVWRFGPRTAAGRSRGPRRAPGLARRPTRHRGQNRERPEAVYA